LDAWTLSLRLTVRRHTFLPRTAGHAGRAPHLLPTWLPRFAVEGRGYMPTDLARNVEARAGLLSWARSGVPGHA
jgi:hypothetical protein